MISFTTVSYSGDFVVSCRNPITTAIQSRKSRNHRHGDSQSSSITQVVCARSGGVNVSCNKGVRDLEGLGKRLKVSRARISPILDRAI